MIIPAILKIAPSDIPYMYYCIYLLFFPLFLPQRNGKKKKHSIHLKAAPVTKSVVIVK